MLSKGVLFFLVGVTLLTAFSSAAESAKAEAKKPENTKAEDKAEDQTAEDKKPDKKADGKDTKDVKIPGEYILQTDPDSAEYKKYMQAMGFSEDVQKLLRETKQVVIIIKNLNETHLQVKRVTENKTYEMIFESGKEFEARLPDGRTVKNTITVNKKEKTANRVIKMDGFEATHDAVFSEKGFNVTFKAKDAVAIFRFKREKSLMDSIKDWAAWFKKKIVGE